MFRNCLECGGNAEHHLIHPSTDPASHPSIHPSILYPSSIRPSVRPSIHPSAHLHSQPSSINCFNSIIPSFKLLSKPIQTRSRTSDRNTSISLCKTPFYPPLSVNPSTKPSTQTVKNLYKPSTKMHPRVLTAIQGHSLRKTLEAEAARVWGTLPWGRWRASRGLWGRRRAFGEPLLLEGFWGRARVWGAPPLEASRGLWEGGARLENPSALEASRGLCGRRPNSFPHLLEAFRDITKVFPPSTGRV